MNLSWSFRENSGTVVKLLRRKGATHIPSQTSVTGLFKNGSFIVRLDTVTFHNENLFYFKFKTTYPFKSESQNHLQIFHPCHEVMSELATWLVPILCRAHGKTPTDFPAGELALKHDLCKNVLALLDQVNPGINRKRGKGSSKIDCTALVGRLSRILWGQYKSLSTKKLDNLGRRSKIVQNCVTLFMDDP